jgi:cytochrome b subunit of formate dehydrogenase
MEFLAGGYAIYMILVFIIAILWILMPFAVFGVKDKLQTLIDETKKNTEATNALHETIKNQGS